MDKKEFIVKLATQLYKDNRTMPASELCLLLNKHGYKTKRGTKYQPNSRGIYRLLKTIWKSLMLEGKVEQEKAVAHVFTDRRGLPAWKK